MKAKELIRYVKECVAENWQNSHLWAEGEELLEQIAEHFEYCKECREAFDVMDYPQRTLIDFENQVLSVHPNLSDWICEKRRRFKNDWHV